MEMTTRKFIKIALAEDEQEAKNICAQLPARLLNKHPMTLRLDQVLDIANVTDYDLTDLVYSILERRCRVCGCTQDDCSQCIEKTGFACHWVDEDLCSACA